MQYIFVWILVVVILGFEFMGLHPMGIHRWTWRSKRSIKCTSLIVQQRPNHIKSIFHQVCIHIKTKRTNNNQQYVSSEILSIGTLFCHYHTSCYFRNKTITKYINPDQWCFRKALNIFAQKIKFITGIFYWFV